MQYFAIIAWVISVAAALGHAHRPGFLIVVSITSFAYFLGVVYVKRSQRNN